MSPGPAREGCLDRVTVGEQRTLCGFAVFRGWVDEFQLDFGAGEGDAIKLKVAQLLLLASIHGNMGSDFFTDIGLPDADRSHTVAGHTQQTLTDGKGAHGSAQVAAVAAPVDDGLLNGHSAKQVVNIVNITVGCDWTVTAPRFWWCSMMLRPYRRCVGRSGPGCR